MAKSLSTLSDAELIAVANQTVTAMTATPALYGAVAGDITALSAAISDAQDAVTEQITAQALAKGATSFKEGKVTTLVDLLRTRRDVAVAHGTSKADMDTTSIPSGSTPVPPNATIPVLAVNTASRLHHTLSWAEATTPDNKKKPRGAMGAEIWRKIDGPLPTDVSDCTFVAIDSSTPYTVEYTGDEAGKMVHYMARWKMRDGATLAFSETVSATVTG